VDFRVGGWGVLGEGQDYAYTFDRSGCDKTQHDIARQRGTTLSFWNRPPLRRPAPARCRPASRPHPLGWPSHPSGWVELSHSGKGGNHSARKFIPALSTVNSDTIARRVLS